MRPALTLTPGGARIAWTRGDGTPETLLLHTSVPLRIEDGTLVGETTLCEGETAYAILCPAREGWSAPDPAYVRTSFAETRAFWHDWVSRGRYPTFWRELVVRSALT